MIPEEAAAKLHGNQYREEGSKALFAEMKAAGLVAVFGASDDLTELRGAIYDEVSAYEGTEIRVTDKGLLMSDCDNADCPYFAEIKKKAQIIKVIWSPQGTGLSWAFETEIPHVTFDILEYEETYCQGIVFRLADVK